MLFIYWSKYYEEIVTFNAWINPEIEKLYSSYISIRYLSISPDSLKFEFCSTNNFVFTLVKKKAQALKTISNFIWTKLNIEICRKAFFMDKNIFSEDKYNFTGIFILEEQFFYSVSSLKPYFIQESVNVILGWHEIKLFDAQLWYDTAAQLLVYYIRLRGQLDYEINRYTLHMATLTKHIITLSI